MSEAVLTLTDSTPVELQRELRELREAVAALQAALGARPILSLRALQERPWLGQPVNVVASVTAAAGGAPQRNAPVTLATTWGTLRANDGPVVEEGASVNIHTDAYGMVEALLLAPLGEPLTEPERSALVVALARLDPSSRSPREALAGLTEIAELYRLETNESLRAAVDMLFHDFGRRRLTAINRRDPLQDWTYQDATLFAYARAEDGAPATAVLATAALPLRFTDWLFPWLTAYQQLVQQESVLRGRFQSAREEETDSRKILTLVQGHVRDFVTQQRGLVGTEIGHRVAESSLQEFSNSGLQGLPRETLEGLIPGLANAERTIASAGTGVLAALGHTQLDLHREIGTRAELLQRGIDLKVNQDAFQTFKTDTTNGLTRVDVQLGKKADAEESIGFRNSAEGRLNALATTRDQQKTQIDKLQSDMAGKADSSRIKGVEDRLDVVTGDLKATRELVDKKADRTEFTDFRDLADQQFKDFATSRDQHRKLIDTLTTDVAKKADVDRIKSAEERFDGEVKRLGDLNTGLSDQLRTVRKAADDLGGAMTEMKRNATQLDTDLKLVRRRLNM